jgi:hypothetical protein
VEVRARIGFIKKARGCKVAVEECLGPMFGCYGNAGHSCIQRTSVQSTASALLHPGGVTAKDSAETTKPDSPHYWLAGSGNHSPMIARPAPGMYRSVDRGGWGTDGS